MRRGASGTIVRSRRFVWQCYIGHASYLLGDCRQESTKALWATTTVAYRKPARFHAAPYDAYTGMILAERHKASTK